MKLLVETTDDFMLFDTETHVWVDYNRPSVVPPSGFINSRAALGHLKILGQVNDEALDADFLLTWTESEGNQELAVSSYLDQYPLPVEPNAEPPKKGKRK